MTGQRLSAFPSGEHSRNAAVWKPGPSAPAGAASPIREPSYRPAARFPDRRVADTAPRFEAGPTIGSGCLRDRSSDTRLPGCCGAVVGPAPGRRRAPPRPLRSAGGLRDGPEVWGQLPVPVPTEPCGEQPWRRRRSPLAMKVSVARVSGERRQRRNRAPAYRAMYPAGKNSFVFA